MIEREVPEPVRALVTAVAGFGLSAMSDRAPLRVDQASWSAFVSAVDSGRVVGHLAEAVRRGEIVLDEEQRDEVADRHLRWMVRTLRLEALMLEVIEMFDAASVEHRVLKGPAAARLDYPDPSHRCFGDVDLLVRSSDIDAATALLATAGLERRYAEPRPGFDRRFSKGAAFVAPDGMELDLHRTLALGPFGLTIDLDELWSRRVEVEIGGRRMYALSDEMRFLHACYHAALGDRTPRLVALRDIAQHIERASFDPETVIRIARTWRGEPVLARALGLVADAFGTEQPVLGTWVAAWTPGRTERRALASYLNPDVGYAARCLVSVRVVPLRQKPAFLFALLAPSREYMRQHRQGWFARLRRAVDERRRLRRHA